MMTNKEVVSVQKLQMTNPLSAKKKNTQKEKTKGTFLSARVSKYIETVRRSEQCQRGG